MSFTLHKNKCNQIITRKALKIQINNKPMLFCKTDIPFYLWLHLFKQHALFCYNNFLCLLFIYILNVRG